jgi:hypothetical protein
MIRQRYDGEGRGQSANIPHADAASAALWVVPVAASAQF